jgi:hypothetical protein
MRSSLGRQGNCHGSRGCDARRPCSRSSNAIASSVEAIVARDCAMVARFSLMSCRRRARCCTATGLSHAKVQATTKSRTLLGKINAGSLAHDHKSLDLCAGAMRLAGAGHLQVGKAMAPRSSNCTRRATGAARISEIIAIRWSWRLTAGSSFRGKAGGIRPHLSSRAASSAQACDEPGPVDRGCARRRRMIDQTATSGVVEDRSLLLTRPPASALALLFAGAALRELHSRRQPAA